MTHTIKWTDTFGNLHYLHNNAGNVRLVLFNGTPMHISNIDHRRAEEIRIELAGCESADEMVKVMKRFGQHKVEAVTASPSVPAAPAVDADAAQVLWSREGGSCIGRMVQILADGTPFGSDTHLSKLVDHARELRNPVEDWESAARDAGWYEDGLGTTRVFRDVADEDTMPNDAKDWQEACELCNLEPRWVEAREYWIVSDWLADELGKRGEKVATDFAGMSVWAVTTEAPVLEHPAIIEIAAAYEPDVVHAPAPGMR